jgi:N-methylhydantoinase A/oxoprolinase/acetone carboxylase beta subunit
MVNLRVTAVGRLPTIRIRQASQPRRSDARQRPAWFPQTGTVISAIHRREELAPGAMIAGPCIIDALDCTAVIPPGWAGTVDADGYIHLRRS